MSSKTQFKCSNKVMTSSDREVTCGAFLMEVNDGIFNDKLRRVSSINFRCRKCSSLHHVSIGDKGELSVIRILTEKETYNVSNSL